ncbi:subtilisin-like protein [Rhizophagus irregularis]|uniref:Subtilisin-like protein n=1 Tax=Rhizophagus irregularis TaxID=588596 RepID=A0A2I1H398_9GLOM|nr:subtilisin-like protein [Rhizophagus irregularis]
MFPSFFKFLITLLLFTSFFYNVNSLKCPKRHYRGKQEKFVVILKDNPSLNSRSLNSRRRDHFNKMSRCLNKTTIPTIPFHDDTNKLDNEKDVLQDFNVENVITGYVGYFDPNFVKDELKDWDDVDVVEKEKTFKVTSWKRKLSKRSSNGIVQQSTTLWNLDRIDQTTNKLDKKFKYPSSAGKGVNIYVIDTGINIAHKEFEGRAKFGASFCDKCSNIDDNGHGTHVAAIFSGKTFGVAKLSNVIAVKVLDKFGIGTSSSVIAGLIYVFNEHMKNKNKNTIINMSLAGSDDSLTINLIMQKLFAAGIHVVVAAGNNFHSNSCNFAPASSPHAITVGAIDESDKLTDFTNIGQCVNIFAPGKNIQIAWKSSNTSTKILDGTSQATPHVSGTIALMISKSGNKSPSQIKNDLINISTKNVLKDIPSKNTNTKILILDNNNDLNIASPNNLLKVPG